MTPSKWWTFSTYQIRFSSWHLIHTYHTFRYNIGSVAASKITSLHSSIPRVQFTVQGCTRALSPFHPFCRVHCMPKLLRNWPWLTLILFMPPGRKPYPRNTFFWVSSCSSLCFDPGVMSILTASVHTSHMLAPWKRSCSKCYAMHWMSPHTSHMLAPWKHSCSKCYGMDCLGTYFTHAQT